jgi:hypothetical protein
MNEAALLIAESRERRAVRARMGTTLRALLDGLREP